MCLKQSAQDSFKRTISFLKAKTIPRLGTVFIGKTCDCVGLTLQLTSASFRQGRLPPQKWDPGGAASLPFIFDGRCRAAFAQGVTRSFANGGMTSVSSQASGAQRRPRVSDKGGSRRKNRTPTARRPYHLFSMGDAAPLSRRASPGRSPMEG